MTEGAPAGNTSPNPETNGEGEPLRARFSLNEKLLSWLLVLAGFYTMYFAQDIFIPIAIALFAGIVLQPLVRLLSRIHIPDSAGAGIVTVGVVSAIIGLGVLVEPSAEKWIDRWPALYPEIQSKLVPVKKTVQKAKKLTEGIEKMAEPGPKKSKETVVREASLGERIFGRTTDALLLIGITLVMAYFVLARSRRTIQNILRSAEVGTTRRRWTEVAADMQHDVATYMLTITAINTALGVLVAIVMYALGMPNPLLWGVLAALLNYLPYLGPLVMLAVLSLVSLLTFDTLGQMSLPPLAYLAMTIIEGQFISPMVVGRRMTLNPLAIFISVLFWGTIWGIAGVFLAVPILASLRVLSDHVESLGFLRPLLR